MVEIRIWSLLLFVVLLLLVSPVANSHGSGYEDVQGDFKFFSYSKENGGSYTSGFGYYGDSPVSSDKREDRRHDLRYGCTWDCSGDDRRLRMLIVYSNGDVPEFYTRYDDYMYWAMFRLNYPDFAPDDYVDNIEQFGRAGSGKGTGCDFFDKDTNLGNLGERCDSAMSYFFSNTDFMIDPEPIAKFNFKGNSNKKFKPEALKSAPGWYLIIWSAANDQSCMGSGCYYRDETELVGDKVTNDFFHFVGFNEETFDIGLVISNLLTPEMDQPTATSLLRSNLEPDHLIKESDNGEFAERVCRAYWNDAGTHWLTDDQLIGDFDINNRCCDPSDVGLRNGGFVCYSDGWHSFASWCEDPAIVSGADFEDNPDLIYGSFDGADGCCGDDLDRCDGTLNYFSMPSGVIDSYLSKDSSCVSNCVDDSGDCYMNPQGVIPLSYSHAETGVTEVCFDPIDVSGIIGSYEDYFVDYKTCKFLSSSGFPYASGTFETHCYDKYDDYNQEITICMDGVKTAYQYELEGTIHFKKLARNPANILTQSYDSQSSFSSTTFTFDLPPNTGFVKSVSFDGYSGEIAPNYEVIDNSKLIVRVSDYCTNYCNLYKPYSSGAVTVDYYSTYYAPNLYNCADLNDFDCIRKDACELTGTKTCQDITTAEDCRYGCTYIEEGDEGFVMTPLDSGVGYTDRYICLQDKAPHDEIIDPLTPIIYKEVGSWRWWDSYSDTPFRIHKFEGVDYISNGDNWSYCDAHGNGDRLAQPVPAYGSFSSSAVDLCAWTPRDFFARKFIDPVTGSSLFLGNYVFTPGCDDKSYDQNTIYDSEYGKMLFDHPWLAGVDDFDADFYVGCCKTSDHVLSDLGWDLFGTDQNSCPEDQGYHCFSRNEGEIIPPDDGPGSCVCVGGFETSNSCRLGLKPVCSDDDSCSCVDEESVSDVDKSGTLDYSFTVDEDGCDDLGKKFNVVGNVCDLSSSTCVFDSLSEYTRIVPVRTQSLDSRKICCLGGSCEPVSGKTCSELGGFEYSTTNTAIAGCDGSVLTSSDGVSFSQGYDSCCLGGIDWVPNSFESVDDVVDAFICYPRSDDISYFGECCSGTSCFNWLLGQSWDGGYTDGFDRGNIFTVGSSLFTVKSFDKVPDNGLGVEDKIKRFRITGDHKIEVRDGDIYKIHFYRDVGALNWSDFDYLVFDMSWSGRYKALNITFNLFDHELSFNISKFVARSTLPPVLWDRVNIPLKDDNGNSLFDSIPQYAYFTFVLDASTAVDSYFYVDNFALKDADESFFKDYYCGGKSRKWVAGLEASPDASSDEIDAYHRACDAQKSSTWTGSRCCGLRSFDVSNPSLSEYYNDSVFGCWAGISVKSSETVSSAYFDPDYYPGIMFYGNKFYACTAGSYPDVSPVNGVISIYDLDDYDQGVLKTADALTPLNLIVKDPFDTVGNYYCDAGSDGKDAVPRWRKTTFLPRAKILASKLYSLVGPGDNFTLFCGNVSEILAVNSLSGVLSGDGITIDEGIATILCALNIHGDDPKIYVGAVLETPSTDPDAFISHIRSFNPLNDLDSFPASCNSYIDDDGNPITVDNDMLSASDSFLRCDDSGEDGSGYGVDVDLNVYHQPNLGLVYFSMEGKGKVGFLQSMWEAVVDFFKNLFKSNAGEEVVSESSPLPAIGIDLYYDADFENIYLARQGDLFVKGVVEKVNSDGDKELRVDFINFTTLVADSLKSLVDPMVQSAKIHDCENTQTLFARMSKDDTFDWRYLTSNMRLISTNDPKIVFNNACELTNSIWNLHNGIIDPGEECDDSVDNPGKVVALQDNDLLKCGSKYLTGSCNDGVLTINGDCKLIFVTSDKYSGSEIGGLIGADAICADLAKEIYRVDAGSAKALLATPDRTLKGLIGTPIAVIDNNGNSQSKRQEIALDADGLFESLHNYFVYDNLGDIIGNEVGSSEYLWSGSLEDGVTLETNCKDWTTSEASSDGTIGDPKLFTYPGLWVRYDGINPALRACDNKYRFLCVVNRD